MDTQPPNNTENDLEPQVIQPTVNTQPKKPEQKSIYPTPTAPSLFTPSPGLSAGVPEKSPSSPPAVTNQSGGVLPRKPKKLVIILTIALVFAIGVIAGIFLQAEVINQPSEAYEIFGTEMEKYYGENWEEEFVYDTNSNEEEENDFQERSQDMERKTDINALHTQYEVYYNDYGYYPTEEVATDASNFRGLDTEALKDPEGRYINTPGSDYTYSAIDCEAADCRSYELSTILLQSDETTYTKSALN